MFSWWTRWRQRSSQTPTEPKDDPLTSPTLPAKPASEEIPSILSMSSVSSWLPLSLSTSSFLSPSVSQQDLLLLPSVSSHMGDAQDEDERVADVRVALRGVASGYTIVTSASSSLLNSFVEVHASGGEPATDTEEEAIPSPPPPTADTSPTRDSTQCTDDPLHCETTRHAGHELTHIPVQQEPLPRTLGQQLLVHVQERATHAERLWHALLPSPVPRAVCGSTEPALLFQVAACLWTVTSAPLLVAERLTDAMDSTRRSRGAFPAHPNTVAVAAADDDDHDHDNALCLLVATVAVNSFLTFRGTVRKARAAALQQALRGCEYVRKEVTPDWAHRVTHVLAAITDAPAAPATQDAMSATVCMCPA